MTGVVCALSGGGAKAAAHLGAIRALEERGFAPSRYVATSMGAVVAACFAAGLPYEEVLVRITRLRRRDVAAFAPRAVLGYFSDALLQDAPLRRTIAKLVPARRFEDLTLPLTVTAVDRQNGQLALFGAGGRREVPLVDALYASCALPVYYPPALIAGREYVDGGLRAVLPLDVADGFEHDLLVGVAVGPSFYEEPAGERAPIPPLVRVAGDVMRIMMADQTEATLARYADRDDVVIVRPPTTAESTFALDRVVTSVEDGYRAAVRALGARSAA